MKKLLMAVLVAVVLLSASCLRRGGLNIVQVIEDSRSLTLTRGAGTFMRERYIGTYPEHSRAMVLAAEDDAGNIIENDVDWVLDDPTLGNLIERDPNRPAMREFIAAKTGESLVTASNGVAMDTARIVIYPGQHVPSEKGWNLRTGMQVNSEAESDIYWPGGGIIRFICGYYTKSNVTSILEDMDELTAEGAIIPGPVDYAYYTNTEQLFLVQARDGALYACIATQGMLIYKPTPVVPAP